jgi:programmed cell death protein 5
MDDELEKLRKKRLQELQQQTISQEDLAEEEQKQQKQFEEQRKAILRTVLTTDARERLGRIKVARPEIAENVENQLIMLAQSGRLKTKVTDEQLQELLKRILPKKRDIKITRKGF